MGPPSASSELARDDRGWAGLVAPNGPVMAPRGRIGARVPSGSLPPTAAPPRGKTPRHPSPGCFRWRTVARRESGVAGPTDAEAVRAHRWGRPGACTLRSGPTASARRGAAGSAPGTSGATGRHPPRRPMRGTGAFTDCPLLLSICTGGGPRPWNRSELFQGTASAVSLAFESVQIAGLQLDTEVGCTLPASALRSA